jgi:hypothetical protein
LSALKVDDLGLRGKIAIIGIEETGKLFYPRFIPLYLDKNQKL